MLIGMVKSGVVGPVANKIDSYRISAIIFDLLRVVYSFAGGKKTLKFPAFEEFAPEANVPKLMTSQQTKSEPQPMSAEEVMRRMDNWSSRYGNDK